MDGIFCANFYESRGGWPACWKTWHARCYNCLGKGKFPLQATEDERGNLWFKEEQQAQCINQGVKGTHAVMLFQCKDCWMRNLEGRLPTPGLDDAFVMCICQANLDVMGGRAVSTIDSHAAAVKRTVMNCAII
jgi:hypothetical protein